MSWLPTVLIALGALVQVVATAGVVLLPDPLDRVHLLAPCGVAALLVAGGVLAAEGPSLAALQGLLVALVVLVGGSFQAHVLGRAVHAEVRRGRDAEVQRRRDTAIDRGSDREARRGGVPGVRRGSDR